ncbi:hypothetical protein B0H66DRAFT_241949 [Apodospora peruviana]|uniref:Zn(2)-C6 fungal-type domain-containing protein n=1 Tax=Apodospora peruviana TaxID=516989 RepID=A0AAE0M5E9_9PEZI|nr:hypothetical protein B0H66DRAFT_241949 [Apodospora peruviana]
MQDLGYPRDDSRISLGHRRGLPDLARILLDLTWARADSESAARLESYPSPPMSGSPPLPPKASQEAAERNQGYQTTTQDVYRGISTTQGDDRAQAVNPSPSRGFAPPVGERIPYGFHHQEGPMPRPLSYSQQIGQVVPQPPYLPAPGAAAGSTTRPLPGPQAYPSSALHPTQESLHQTSSKAQRKTKGHVASACVPCKKAHLRCDAQRPCSRCLSNGKEEACVDVQHKKRGRPRLRDDRGEIKYDSARFGSAPDPMRRQISSFYAPGTGVSSMGMAYDDNLRRTQSYRVLKSQPAEPNIPRFPERGSASDANIFPAPLSISTRIPEPAAFLTVDLEFSKASSPFHDAVGRTSIIGLKLVDLVVPQDREKASNLERRMQDEQKRRAPTYLPPIFGKEKEDQVMQTLGFSSEEISRYTLDWHEYLNFLGQDGQARQIPVRMGLAMRDSIYFVVLVLNLATRSFQYPTPSPNPRDITYSYQPVQQAYSQPTPVSATFDPRQARLGDSGYGTRQLAQPGAPSQAMTGLSPGLPSSYSASPNRPDYGGGTSPYQIPRSELHPVGRPSQAPGYQLPPIRSQQPSVPQQQESPYQAREERSRVDIGGLLDRPDTLKSPQR